MFDKRRTLSCAARTCAVHSIMLMHPCHTHKSLRVLAHAYVWLSSTFARPTSRWPLGTRSHSSGRRCNRRDIIANEKTPCAHTRTIWYDDCPLCEHDRSISTIYISMECEFRRNRIARHSCRHVSKRCAWTVNAAATKSARCHRIYVHSKCT